MKFCTKCHVEKEPSAFYSDKTKPDKKRPECKSCFNARMKETRKGKAYLIRFNPYQREWQRSYRKTERHKAWRKKALEKQSIRARELKREIMLRYGGKCICCEIDDVRFLSLDHVNNDGYLERAGKKNRPSGYFMYKRIVTAGYPTTLQVMCFNCNIGRQHNGGECPHKTYVSLRNS